MTSTLGNWPGQALREPTKSQPGWSVRRPLADWLRREGAAVAGKRVLDVGCGVKPYYPFFADAAAYVGLDVQENPHADLHGPIEALPVEDASFDVVLCTQVLEHVEDPDLAVRELHRVTARGGRVLASTHGVMVYHPNPSDHWRWTHTGLEKLFSRNGDWVSIDVQPGAGTASTLAFLVSQFTHLLAKRAHAPWAARPLITLMNTIAARLDAHLSVLRGQRPGALHANFHVTAVRGE